MTRLLHALAPAALILLAVLSLDARFARVRADDVADCTKGRGDTRLRGCSRIIKSRRLFGRPISKKDLGTVYYNRGFGYSNKGHYDRAIADYGKAIKLNPKFTAAYYNRGNVHRYKGQYDRAIADYTLAIKFDPKDATAYFNRGLSYSEKDDYDRAIADYDKGLKLNPKDAKAYNGRGVAYYHKGQYDRAIADYNKAIILNPKDALAYDNRGIAYSDKGQYDRAITEHGKAIKLNPKSANAYANRGLAYEKSGQRDKAIADYRKAIELRPGDKVATSALKRLDAQLAGVRADYVNDCVKARGDISILACTRAIKSGKWSGRNLAWAYFNRGLAFNKKGQYDRAIADYGQAIKLKPKYAKAYKNRGNAYRNKGDYDRAIADYGKAIKLSPKDDAAYNNRGLAYYKKGQYDRAIADYSQAIKLNPKYAEAYNNRSRVYGKIGQRDKSLADLSKALELVTKEFAATRSGPKPRGGDEFQDCDTCPKMVVVPAGSFTMGSPASESKRNKDEGPRHKVRIPKPFAAGKFEVTFAEWEACVTGGGCGGYRPGDSGWGRGTRPVINVSWINAKAYVAWLSKKTGKEYRLLSESEWEYAVRAGTLTPFSTGRTITTDQANFSGQTYNGSRRGRFREKTTSVGSFAANAFGLHDLHGNVREWVEDCWNENYRSAPSDGRSHTGGNCNRRVLRGGSWLNHPGILRSAARHWLPAEFRLTYTGFRVARMLNP